MEIISDWLFKIFAMVGSTLLMGGIIALKLPESAWLSLAGERKYLKDQAGTSAFLLFSGILTIGLTLISLSLPDLIIGLRSKDWIAHEAVVTDSYITSSAQIRSNNPAYRPNIHYTYIFNGRNYDGDRLSFGSQSTPDYDFIQAELNELYRPGQQIRIYIDPKIPENSVIRAGFEPISSIFALLGLSFISIGIWQLRVLRAPS
jgi:hypothetical protein